MYLLSGDFLISSNVLHSSNSFVSPSVHSIVQLIHWVWIFNSNDCVFIYVISIWFFSIFGVLYNNAWCLPNGFYSCFGFFKIKNAYVKIFLRLFYYLQFTYKFCCIGWFSLLVTCFFMQFIIFVESPLAGFTTWECSMSYRWVSVLKGGFAFSSSVFSLVRPTFCIKVLA